MKKLIITLNIGTEALPDSAEAASLLRELSAEFLLDGPGYVPTRHDSGNIHHNAALVGQWRVEE